MKKYSIKDLVNKIQNKEISCEEVIDFYIKEIEKKEDKIEDRGGREEGEN